MNGVVSTDVIVFVSPSQAERQDFVFAEEMQKDDLMITSFVVPRRPSEDF